MHCLLGWSWHHYVLLFDSENYRGYNLDMLLFRRLLSSTCYCIALFLLFQNVQLRNIKVLSSNLPPETPTDINLIIYANSIGQYMKPLLQVFQKLVVSDFHWWIQDFRKHILWRFLVASATRSQRVIARSSLRIWNSRALCSGSSLDNDHNWGYHTEAVSLFLHNSWFWSYSWKISKPFTRKVRFLTVSIPVLTVSVIAGIWLLRKRRQAH
jgi:hypothetical protein